MRDIDELKQYTLTTINCVKCFKKATHETGHVHIRLGNEVILTLHSGYCDKHIEGAGRAAREVSAGRVADAMANGCLRWESRREND